MISALTHPTYSTDDIESPTAPDESWDCTCPMVAVAILVAVVAVGYIVGFPEVGVLHKSLGKGRP